MKVLVKEVEPYFTTLDFTNPKTACPDYISISPKGCHKCPFLFKEGAHFLCALNSTDNPIHYSQLLKALEYSHPELFV